VSAWAWTASHNRTIAEVFIHDVQAVPWSQFSHKIIEMAPYRGWVDSRLRELLRGSPADPELRARLALALLPSDPARANELAERLLACGPDEHRVIRAALRDYWTDVAAQLRAPVEDPRSDSGQRTKAAAALIALDGPRTPAARAWSELGGAEVPDSRTELLDWLVRSQVEPTVLLRRLERETDPTIRRLLLQGLAELGDGPPAVVPPAFLSSLVAIYRHDPDPGIHSSAAYLLRRWGQGGLVQRLDAELAGRPRENRRWFVNSLGQTMAVLGAIGSTESAPPLHGRHPYQFAIATTETTLGQYQKFDPEHPSKRKDHNAARQTNPDAPADVVSYDDAARFCNWLSKEERLPPDQWCYLPGDSNGHMVMVPDYRSRRGYRLPNLEEWEYAARAGTSTDRYFGQSLTHAVDYAWYDRNTQRHPEPVGLKRPNDFGLFDVLGNLAEWCYNPEPPHWSGCQCKAPRGVDCREYRVVSLRGGSFFGTEDHLIAKPIYQSFDMLDSHEKYHYTGFRTVKLEP
jgi:formylglycine-generating enzyme required for sulfatase activity